jgi:hypothetical protein
VAKGLSEDKIAKQIRLMETKYEEAEEEFEDSSITNTPDMQTTGFFEDIAVI